MNLTTKFINLLARHKEISGKTSLNGDKRMNLTTKFIDLLVKRMNVTRIIINHMPKRMNATGIIINQMPKRMNFSGVTPRHKTLLLNIIKIYLHTRYQGKRTLT